METKTNQYQSKHEFIDLAIDAARGASMSGKTIHVIESNGEYYADESEFLRSWETIHTSFKNGEEINE